MSFDIFFNFFCLVKKHDFLHVKAINIVKYILLLLNFFSSQSQK